MSAAKQQQSFALPIIGSFLLLLQQKIQQVPQHPEQIKCYLLAPSALKRERERERESFLHQQIPKNTLRVWRRERVRELKPLKPSLPKPSSSSLLFRLRMHARLARSWRRPHPSIGRYCYIGIFLCLELVSWACRLRLVLAWPSIRALLHCFWTRNTCRPCRRRLHRRRRFF